MTKNSYYFMNVITVLFCQFVILELTPVADIDTTGIHSLHELYKQLKAKDVTVINSKIFF